MNIIPKFRERDRGRFEDLDPKAKPEFYTQEYVWDWYDKWEKAGCMMYDRWPILNPTSG